MKLKESLQKILDRLHRNFRYKTDMEQFGTPERWMDIPADFVPENGLTGDCEDFSAAARKLCRDAGIQNSRLVVCTNSAGGHCVLEVEGWVLDCNSKRIETKRSMERKGCKWLAISGYEPGDPWLKLERSINNNQKRQK